MNVNNVDVYMSMLPLFWLDHTWQSINHNVIVRVVCVPVNAHKKLHIHLWFGITRHRFFSPSSFLHLHSHHERPIIYTSCIHFNRNRRCRLKSIIFNSSIATYKTRNNNNNNLCQFILFIGMFRSERVEINVVRHTIIIFLRVETKVVANRNLYYFTFRSNATKWFLHCLKLIWIIADSWWVDKKNANPELL